MKHPVRDRFWVLFCALVALCGAASAVALVLGVILFSRIEKTFMDTV